MDKLTYVRGISTKEPSKIELEFSNGLTAFEFRNICVRMAKSLGYADTSVECAFPKPKNNEHEADKAQLKLLFD